MKGFEIASIVVVGFIVGSWFYFGGGRALWLYRKATASKPRCVVFSVLLIWTLYDSVMTFRDWGDLPLFFRVCGFFGSLLLSLWFVGLIAIAWDWLARRVRRT